jgi:tripartite-type tricarboxylate transporter receptor subunit TctC
MDRRSALKLISATGPALGINLLPNLGLSTAVAQTNTGPYPNRPIKFIVPFAPGISPDVIARLISDRLAQSLGQPVIVDNRPGAGGMIGAEAAAITPGDGYNIFFAVKSVMAIAPHVYSTAKYNPLKDFKSVSQILIVPHVITAAPNVPYNNLKELVEYAKKNPGKIDYASLGVGSQPHIAMEAWAQKLGIKLTHIPYKSNPAADVMSGVVSLSLEASTTAIPSIKAGKIKGIAISGSNRIESLPDVPTVTEYGSTLDVNGNIGNSWHGIFAPASTPDSVITKLNTEIIKIVKTPEVQERMRYLGLTPTGTTAQTLASAMSGDYAFGGQLIRELDIKVE